MTTRFLCPNHRHWLQSNPKAAIAHLSDTQDTGQWYREQGLWSQALPYLGCAFETAEIVLNTSTKNQATAVITFTSCAVLLGDTWHKLGELGLSRQAFQSAQQRLIPELSLYQQQSDIQACITDCIQALAKGMEVSSSRFNLSYEARMRH
ncbi:hypothetical protein [Flavobacterium sp. W21_SRS_FM6]|uniref:hypothetical protein n=1 Tax=Flavobacterium sp. W21_SRS_FM6 TaxID=3240268 RepID=UPI003F9269B9